jgi:hypothetical protein
MRSESRYLGGSQPNLVLLALRLAGTTAKPNTTKLREGRMNHTIYIIDRAGQYRQESYLTAEEKYLAADRWDSLGADIYQDQVQSLVEFDKTRNFNLGNRHDRTI